MSTVLRPYQETLLGGVSDGWRAGMRRMLLQCPTGGGKGRILSAAAARTAARGKRITLMAHRAELVEQICANLDDEGVPHGRIAAGWPMVRYPVMVGMVQTIVRRLGKLEPPDLLLTDECHHAAAGQYIAISDAWQSARMLGVTATPIRTDGQGLDAHFDGIVCGPSVAELIDQKYLADYDYYEPSPDFDMGGVKKQAGDYKPADALRIISKSKIVGDAVEHYSRHLAGRPAIAFCMGIQHCEDTAAQFNAAGIRATHVDGEMPMEMRRSRLAALASGQIDVLMAADVISEGVDIPQVAGAILLRPTCSTGLFLQQVGRALRPKPDGSRATILDHVNNAKRHGLPADPRKWSLAGIEKMPPVETRECETCFRVFPRAEASEIAEAECDRASTCPILHQAQAEGDQSRLPDVFVSGVLQAVKNPWAWAGGIDPVLARGPEFRALVDRAQTEEQLRMIARARGYRRGWSTHIMRARLTA